MGKTLQRDLGKNDAHGRSAYHFFLSPAVWFWQRLVYGLSARPLDGASQPDLEKKNLSAFRPQSPIDPSRSIPAGAAYLESDSGVYRVKGLILTVVDEDPLSDTYELGGVGVAV